MLHALKRTLPIRRYWTAGLFPCWLLSRAIWTANHTMAHRNYLFLLWLISLAAFGCGWKANAQSTTPSCTTGYMVYFANGIDNDADDSLAGGFATQNLIGPTLNGQPIQY